MAGIIGEVFVRLNPRLYCNGYRPSKNDKLVYELYPGYLMKSLNAKISSQGLNDKVYPIKKDKGIFRIAVVGDSMSFGWKVGARDSFPKALEAMLNAEGGRKFEVINFSVPGYNTAQEYELIKDKVIKFNPDMVIVNFCWNDVQICNYIKPKITFTNWLYNRSYLVRLLLWRLDWRFANTFYTRDIWLAFKKYVLGMYYYNHHIYTYPGLEATVPSDLKENTPERYRYMVGYDNYKIHLDAMAEFLKKSDVIFVNSGEFTDEALRVNAELGIKNIRDFNELFKAIPKTSVYLSAEDGHYTRQANRMVAEYLYNFLKKLTK